MKSLLICFALLVFAGCSNDDDTPAFTPQNITPVLVGKGLLNPTPLFTRETRVITTPAQWQQLLADMETAREGITQDFTETAVDFTAYEVIAAYIVGSSGTTIDVIDVTENEDTVTVTLDNLRQGATQDVTHPFHIIKIPRTTKPIVFNDISNMNN